MEYIETITTKQLLDELFVRNKHVLVAVVDHDDTIKIVWNGGLMAAVGLAQMTLHRAFFDVQSAKLPPDDTATEDPKEPE